MTSYADSRASFEHRAKEVQLRDEHIRALDTQDIGNFNQLAFAICSQPGQIDQARFQDLVDAVFPLGASLGVQAALRQLAYESITVAVAAIKQRIEVAEEGTTRRLPAQERDERLRRQRARVTGIPIQGEYEPAHCVVDAFVTMLDECVLRILPLSKCVSRDQELAQSKTDKQVVTLENHQLHVKAKGSNLEANLSNELRVHNAMIRRGLAMDQAGLMTFAVHDTIMRNFLSHITRPAPPGFAGPDIQAVLRADQELWTRCADVCKSQLRVGPDGKPPLDVAAEELYTTPTVVFHLLPVPSRGKRARSDSPKKERVKEKKEKKNPKSDKAGKSKLPETLKGLSGVNKKKQRICYNYNLAHGCTSDTSKDEHSNLLKCGRGMHQCMKCHGAHSLTECPKN